jgi:hypothetical protein
MLSNMKICRLLPLLLLALSGPLHAEDGPALPAWLAGTWQMQQGSAWAEELWTAPRDGMMLGINRAGFGPTVESWDLIRIQRKPDGRLVYSVQERGGQAIDFVMRVASDEAIEFTNPAHDFPQRLRFWRQGQLLMAEAAKMDGSNVTRWNYRPVAGPVDDRP